MKRFNGSGVKSTYDVVLLDEIILRIQEHGCSTSKVQANWRKYVCNTDRYSSIKKFRYFNHIDTNKKTWLEMVRGR